MNGKDKDNWEPFLLYLQDFSFIVRSFLIGLGLIILFGWTSRDGTTTFTLPYSLTLLVGWLDVPARRGRGLHLPNCVTKATLLTEQ